LSCPGSPFALQVFVLPAAPVVSLSWWFVFVSLYLDVHFVLGMPVAQP
jgi:hypothetical protein